MQRIRTHQHGQVIVLTAILLPVLLAFAGVCIDGGRLWMDRNQCQISADAAALAGAQSLPGDVKKSQDTVARLLDQNRVFGNPFENYETHYGIWDEEKHQLNSSSDPDAVQVVVHYNEKLFFWKVLHLAADTTRVDATATATKMPGDQNISLILDRSGSMGEGLPIDEQPLTVLKRACHTFFAMLRKSSGRHSVGLVTFSSTAKTEIQLTRKFQDIEAKIDIMKPSGATNIGRAVHLGNDDVFKGSGRIDKATDVVILLTDGGANCMNAGPSTDRNIDEDIAQECDHSGESVECRLDLDPGRAEAKCEAERFRYSKGGRPPDPDQQDEDRFLFTIMLGQDPDTTHLRENVASKGRCRWTPEKPNEDCAYESSKTQANIEAVFREILKNGPVRLVD